MDEKNQSPLPKIEILDLKPLEKPLTKLIESISKGIGGYYKPIGIIREAKAQAEANLILAHAKVEEQEIAYRAAERLTFLEMRRQKNIDTITTTAAKLLPNFSEGFILSWPSGKPQKSDVPFSAIPRPFTITPLTDVGMELATIVSCEPIPTFGKEIMENIAKEYGMTLSISPT